MIKTWQERCEQYEGIVTNQMIKDKMQEEIDELRQALAQREFPMTDQPIWSVDENGNKQLVAKQNRAQPEQEPMAWMCSNEFVRKGCIRISNSKDETWNIPLYTAPPSIEAAVLAEREACAKVCDAEATIEGIAQKCAAAIRARGEK